MKMIRTLSLLLGFAFCFLCGCAPADPEPIEVPYMDEVICDSDDYIIDREKQLSLKQKILRKF